MQALVKIMLTKCSVFVLKNYVLCHVSYNNTSYGVCCCVVLFLIQTRDYVIKYETFIL